jgi:hypothetical protein
MEIGFFMPSCHHCLRVDPSTDLGLQGRVASSNNNFCRSAPQPDKFVLIFMWLFIPSAEKHVLLICVRDASVLQCDAVSEL